MANRSKMKRVSRLLLAGMLLAAVAFAQFTFSPKAYASTAVFNGTDTTTQGAWKSAYGNDGYVLANYTGTADVESLPSYISSKSYSGESRYSWGATSDPKALEPVSGSRMSAAVYSYTNFTVTLNANDSGSHQLALYFDDYDNFSRTGTVEILDMSNNVLSTQSLSNYYTTPVYFKYTVSGSVKVRLTNTHQNIVLMGIFWGGAYNASASYIGRDTTTQGAWKSAYGADGYVLANYTGTSDVESLPSYISSKTYSGESRYTWGTTNDPKALEPVSGSRMSTTVYSPTSFTVTLRAKDNISHQLAMYFDDFDNFSRTGTVEIMDMSGNVLDTQSLSNYYTAPVYLKYNVAGSIQVRFTNTHQNIVLMGIFWGGAYNGATTTTVNDRTTGTGQNQFEYVGSWTYGYGADNADSYYGNVSWSNTTNDYLQVRFTGTRIRFYGKQAAHHGIGAVSIVGETAETNVDFYAPSNTYKVLLYESPVLPNGTHTLKVRVPGLKNASSTGYYVVPDYVEIDNPAAPIATWNLNTTDTNLQLGVFSNGPAILSLQNPGQGWNWIKQKRVIPLPTTVYIGGTPYTPNWTYQDATAITNGVSLRFTSTSPVLELKSVWTAKPGEAGPVEFYSTIENKTGGDITFNQSDVIAADLNLQADQTVTLKRFNRYSDGSQDANPNTAVFSDTFGANSIINTINENSPYVYNAQLPFHMLDVNGIHGLYLGYQWTFGRAALTPAADPKNISYVHSLWNSGTITEANTKILKIPAMFVGTYQGDIDDGSNAMKKWFWNNKITASLRNNSNEPMVELSGFDDSEAGWSDYFSGHDPAGLGVELVKMDAWWTRDVNSDPNFGWSWDPDTAKWPNGVTLGNTAHAHGVQLSLYMANRYQHNDLGTQAGRDAEKAALLTRYDNWHYDYWRSDMESEGIHSYQMHEGLMEVLDYMIANRSGFRWENCSAGGSLKDFTVAQRMTFMTQDDTGASLPGPVNQRKAFYAGSYMLNAVQLKGDMNLVDGPQTTTWLNYAIRSQMLGAVMNNALTTLQETVYKDNITLYKNYQRPILRGGDVYHILPWADGTNWDGVQFFNKGITSGYKGSVFLFHPSASAPSSKVIKLKGLDRNATYTLTFQERTSQNTTMTGGQLMDNGINVTGMTGDYATEIIWIS